MVASRSRTRAKAEDSATEQPQASIDTATAGIMRNADMLAELHKQRDELAILAQKSAAAEERAFHMAATIRDLQEQYHRDVQDLREKLADARPRLAEVERHGRRLFKTIRNHRRGPRDPGSARGS